MSPITLSGYIIGVPMVGRTQNGSIWANFLLSVYGGTRTDGTTIRHSHRCVVYDNPSRHVYLASMLTQSVADGFTFDDEQYIVIGDLVSTQWERDGRTMRDSEVRVNSMGVLQDYHWANQHRAPRPPRQLTEAQIAYNLAQQEKAQALVAEGLADPNDESARQADRQRRDSYRAQRAQAPAPAQAQPTVASAPVTEPF